MTQLSFPLIPMMLLVTLLGALATFLSPRRYVPLVALVSSAPALAVTTMLFLKTGFTGKEYIAYSSSSWFPGLNSHLEFGVDGLSASLAWLTAVLTPLVIIYSYHEKQRPQLFFSLLVLMDATVIGVFTSLDLLLFYVFWEFVLIPMYMLIAVWGGANRKYASTKFFIYTGTASLVMLLGFMALYFAGGHTFSIPALAQGSAQLGGWIAGAPMLAGFLFLVLAIGFLVKMPSVPFHTWLPDAHVQAPTAGSVILAGVLLKMGSYGLMRIAIPLLGPTFTATQHWGMLVFTFQGLFFWVGVVSVLYGAFLCLAQDDLKSLIAYSSVSHMGMITMALATMTELGWAGAAFMNVAHGIISAGMFMAAGSLQHATGTRQISKLGGIGQRLPVLLGLTLTLFLASLGLPGMMGFIAEFTIFASVWAQYHWLILVPIWSILITAGYYLWAIQRAYHGPERRHPDVDWNHMHDVPAIEKWPMLVLIVLAVVFFLMPSLLLDQANGWTSSALGAVQAAVGGIH